MLSESEVPRVVEAPSDSTTGNASDAEVGDPVPKLSASHSAILTLDDFVAYGSCWDVFRGHWSAISKSAPPSNQDQVIVKVCCPSSFPSQPEYWGRSAGMTDLDARSNILNEMKALYLIGQIPNQEYTPFVHATYAACYAGHDCWVVVMEDVKTGMTADEAKRLSSDEK